jgi:hypothetical protein
VKGRLQKSHGLRRPFYCATLGFGLPPGTSCLSLLVFSQTSETAAHPPRGGQHHVTQA